ncbi:MAG TPA: transglutaminase domain-containing protein, partial [Rhodanobacteraceae bacterium]|nr:transglutaminase domain-containing protein [Rhodanobacteraceae bacterium]
MLRSVRRARIIALASALLLPVAAAALEPDPTVARTIAQIDAGQFAAASAQISHALAQPAVDTTLRDALEFQRERMRRILLDFTLSEDDVKARLRKQIPDLSDAEFTKWDGDGLLEHRVID